MSETYIGQVEEIPITWKPTNNICSICGQDQFNAFQGDKFIGFSCPQGHWNVDGLPKNPVPQQTVNADTPIPDTSPPGTITSWSRDLSDIEIERFNQLQEYSEQLTNQMKEFYKHRDLARQEIAAITCPFTIGMCIETGTGGAPKDRKVITRITGGNSLVGENWRAWGRVLKKDGKLGDKAYRIHISDKGFRIKGQYAGVEGLPVEEMEDDMIV